MSYLGLSSFETDFGVVFEIYLFSQWVNANENSNLKHIKYVIMDSNKTHLKKELKNAFTILKSSDLSAQSAIVFLSSQSYDQAVPVNDVNLQLLPDATVCSVDCTPKFNKSICSFAVRECIQLLSNVSSPELIVKRIVFICDDDQTLTTCIEVIQKALFKSTTDIVPHPSTEDKPRHNRQQHTKPPPLPKCTTFDYLSHQLKPNDALSYRAAGVLLTRINRLTGQREILLGRDSDSHDELSFLVGCC
jgi:hypothetical protein